MPYDDAAMRCGADLLVIYLLCLRAPAAYDERDYEPRLSAMRCLRCRHDAARVSLLTSPPSIDFHSFAFYA